MFNSQSAYTIDSIRIWLPVINPCKLCYETCTSFIFQVSATTFDNEIDIVVYSIRSSTSDGLSIFEIDEETGDITVLQNATNAEDVIEYTLVVEAQDKRFDPIR